MFYRIRKIFPCIVISFEISGYIREAADFSFILKNIPICPKEFAETDENKR
jgi:hypothetical protein